MQTTFAILATMAAALAAAIAAANPASVTKAPIDITSEVVEVRNPECVSVFTGSAEAVQGPSRLQAGVLTVHRELAKGKPKSAAPPSATSAPAAALPGPSAAMASSDCGDIVTMDAEGAVYFQTPLQQVHGDHAHYDAASTTITVTGDVAALQGQDVMHGARMIYNTLTGEGHLQGSGKGRAAPGRVRGVFYPKAANE